ncbi:hypothetical protein B0J13DRAFT_677371 [Dactylonectria estremocensis]|uniref:Uncharacterized protein n=1 Tax=Dactylonectria estremocensis TaxID=1079267 RepID=A0A9P9EGP5_9HYPO|nr:hypothetical protein B0J13DRAFT_677371 [Dactylonectria estremocensis]
MSRHRTFTRRSRTDKAFKRSHETRSSSVATEHTPGHHSCRRNQMNTCQVPENTVDRASEQDPPLPPRKEPVETKDVEAKIENVPEQTEAHVIDPITQSRITELEQQLQAVTQEWKKSARELDELQASNEKSNQMNDGTLIERARQLRYAIWAFSIQYFQGDTPARRAIWWRKDHGYFRYLENTTPSFSALEYYLRHPTKRAKVVAAFLWQVLHCRIFDWFIWAGEDVGWSIRKLRRFLNAKNHPPSIGKQPPRPDAEREFQMWSTTTVELVQDELETNGSEAAGAEIYMEEQKNDITKSVKELFRLEDESQGIAEHLKSILDDAFALDKIMSQQVARLEWVFDPQTPRTTGFMFVEETMELDEGDSDKMMKEGREVRLVVAPALVKRGKSTGQEFEKERILLKTSVWFHSSSVKFAVFTRELCGHVISSCS